MREPKHGRGLTRLSPLGVWLFGLGALGLVRGFMRAFRGGSFDADPIAWLWLGGSVALAAAGLVALVRATGTNRGTTDPD